MNTETKLLPCPFCGVHAVATDEMFGSVIHCDHLHTCPLDGHEKFSAAIHEWNTRIVSAEDVRALGDEPVVYTCIGKGGRYEILGLATGAGLTRGEDRLVYRDTSTNRLFLRTEADFSLRMTRLRK